MLSAFPRYSDIKTVVTAQEVSGNWGLRTNNLPVLKVDGYVPKPGEEIFITLRTNLTYSCRMVERVFGTSGKARIWQEEGTWSLYFNPRDFEGKNQLQLKTSQGGVSGLRIALDDGKMVLWGNWGDPDERIDLVFERTVEGTNAVNGEALR